MPKKRPKGFRHVANPKVMNAVYLLLRASVILVMVAQFFNRNYENVFLCILTLILFLLPSLIERKLQVDLPDTLEIIILLFAYSAEILGEIQAFYIIFPYWDTILHRHERFSLHLSPFFMAVTAFCFSMTIGVVWEFFEFFMDQVFLFDMQKDTVLNAISTVMLDPNHGTLAIPVQDITDVILIHGDGTQTALGLGGYLDIGLHDTMADLFVNFIGAVIFSTVGFFYVRSKGKGSFARRFIPKVVPPSRSDSEKGE